MLALKCGSMFKVIFLIVTVVLIKVNSQTSCTTQRLFSALCVPILTCETTTQLLSSAPRPLPPSIVQIVRQLHCATVNGIHHVCCEPNHVTGRRSADLISTRTITTRRSVAKSDSDVQSGMAILQASQCGKHIESQQVSFLQVGNGDDAELSEYPWLALLVYDDGVDRSMDCGGSLITDRYVLTAAHCIRVGSKRLVSVRLGEHDTNATSDCWRGRCAPPIQEIGIKEAVYHTDYSPSQFSNDIGLIRLVSRAIFRSNVQPICLPVTRQSQSPTFDRMIIAGWGRTETGVKANILQKAEVPFRSNDFCQNIHRVVQITDKHLCAGGADQIDTCRGDSGGPIFVFGPYSDESRNIQYGIISAGSSQCGSNFPSIYVRVTSYLSWIAGNLSP